MMGALVVGGPFDGLVLEPRPVGYRLVRMAFPVIGGVDGEPVDELVTFYAPADSIAEAATTVNAAWIAINALASPLPMHGDIGAPPS